MKIGSTITFFCKNSTVIFTVENVDLTENFELRSIRFGTTTFQHTDNEVNIGLGTTMTVEEIQKVVREAKAIGQKVRISW